MGLCVVGAMIASMVSFSIPLSIEISGATVKVQSIFDQIMPSILPLGLTFVIYTLLKYSLQGTTQGNGLTGGLPPVRFSM